MINKRQEGFSYFYLRYKKGPYSFEVDNDIKILCKAGVIRTVGWNLVLTQYGRSIVKDFSVVLDQNSFLTAIIDETVQTYHNYSLEELLNEVYSLPHPYV